jgi:hypothetical protein
VVGSAATVAMVIVGCSRMTDGTPVVDQHDALLYRASVSASIDASKSSSVTRESERQASLTTQAVRTVCEDMSTSSVDAVNAVNAYVTAANNHGDMQSKVGPAADALNRSADLVSSGVVDALAPDLRAALTDWVDAARALATAISSNASVDAINAATDRTNTAKTNALDRCDKAYR